MQAKLIQINSLKMTSSGVFNAHVLILYTKFYLKKQ